MVENIEFIPNQNPVDYGDWLVNSQEQVTYHHAFFVHYGWKRYWLKSKKQEVVDQVLQPLFAGASELYAYHLDAAIMATYATNDWSPFNKKLRVKKGQESFDHYQLLLRKLWTQAYLDEIEFDFKSFFSFCFDPFILKTAGSEFGKSRWQSALKKVRRNNQVVVCSSPGHLIPIFGIRAGDKTIIELFNLATQNCRITESWREF